MMACFQNIGLSADDDQSFSKYLEKEEKFEEDNVHLAGK
jgi:hypothetical protein